MTRIHASAIAVSADGFAAGTDQSLENPLGVRGPDLMQWFFPTQTWQGMYGSGSGTTGVDNQFAAKSMTGNGAWILGRNMFGPIRGEWPDDQWKGWWGNNPPYHVPTFVLTHYPRDPIIMEGGTSFHFITDGIHAALDAARKVAGDKDIRVGGGAATIRQYLTASLLDDLHIAISPVLLGKGEALWANLDLPALGYQIAERAEGENATHLVIRKASEGLKN